MKKYMKYNELSESKKETLKGINKEFNEKTRSRIYDSFINVLSTIDNKQSIDIIRKLATVKPIYNFQTVFDLLREFSDNPYDVQGDFIELRKYIGFEIDVFMLINVVFC